MKCYKKDYPRPQFVRDNWVNLNGMWDFVFDDADLGEGEEWFCEFPKEREIKVPFTYETRDSLIGDESIHEVVWYHRTIQSNSEDLQGHDRILHFEGSDYYTKVWVNQKLAGEHKGGYSRFSFNITNLLKDGENDITVRIFDQSGMEQPRGKQRWEKDSYGCWYVQTTGIWKTVWMELVPKVHLNKIKMTPVYNEDCLDLEVDLTGNIKNNKDNLLVEITVSFQETFINRIYLSANDNHLTARMNLFNQHDSIYGIRYWSPENPNLYDITYRIVKNQQTIDEVGSYFGMREIRVEGSNILLNDAPLYQRLILDQGYWKDSHLTPPSEEAIIDDIEKIIALGYNGLRKHQKIEDERFLYWCDVKGVLVWSEFPSTYRFTDTAAEVILKEWMEIVRQNYNHPCIITWTPVNESWGVDKIRTNIKQQKFTEAIYYLTKTFDSMRPVIVNDGWEHTISDIITLHDYEECGQRFFERYLNHSKEILSTEIAHNCYRNAFANGYHYKGQPIIISEYGGIAFNNDDSGWGYGNKVNTEEDFVKRFEDITLAIKKIPYVSGYCYTQVTDVQQEINGLLDMDRNYKISPEVISEINKRNVRCF
ncbi:MAG: glycoside hydrolase family 2 TIM barrel-domain containing protein [Mobilitalea sp.]